MERVLHTTVIMDAVVGTLSRNDDISGILISTTTQLPELPAELPQRSPDGFSIGLIVGFSSSGKSTTLRSCFGRPANENLAWAPDQAVISQVGADSLKRMMAVGLNSIPTWQRPFHALSDGERARVTLARCLGPDVTIDGFGDKMDRENAACMAACIGRLIRRCGWRGVVFASAHPELVSSLQPDWVLSVSNLRVARLVVARRGRAPPRRLDRARESACAISPLPDSSHPAARCRARVPCSTGTRASLRRWRRRRPVMVPS